MSKQLYFVIPRYDSQLISYSPYLFLETPASTYTIISSSWLNSFGNYTQMYPATFAKLVVHNTEIKMNYFYPIISERNLS